MAIATNNVITYNQLIDKVVDFIAEKCVNISNTTPSITPITPTGGYINNSNPGNWNNKNIGGQTTVTLTVKDTIYENSVEKSKIKDQLNTFLKGRNLYSLTNSEISQKSLINYVSNISSFVCSKMVQVCNSFSNKADGYLVYLSNNSTSGEIVDVNNLDITAGEIENNTKSIVDVNSLTSNVHPMQMNINYHCSSSSSSCSSSSCSSSSSLFVAYMNIN